MAREKKLWQLECVVGQPNNAGVSTLFAHGETPSGDTFDRDMTVDGTVRGRIVEKMQGLWDELAKLSE